MHMKDGEYYNLGDHSIYGGWAGGLFEVFHSLCWVTKDNDDFVRMHSIRLWMRVFPGDSHTPQFLQRVGARLWLMMKEWIVSNLTEKAYPRMTRLFLNYEGHLLFFGHDKERRAKLFPNHEFLEIFVKNFQACFDSDSEYTRGLLPEGPDGIEFDEKEKSFVCYHHRTKEKRTVSLKELADLL